MSEKPRASGTVEGSSGAPLLSRRRLFQLGGLALIGGAAWFMREIARGRREVGEGGSIDFDDLNEGETLRGRAVNFDFTDETNRRRRVTVELIPAGPDLQELHARINRRRVWRVLSDKNGTNVTHSQLLKELAKRGDGVEADFRPIGTAWIAADALARAMHALETAPETNDTVSIHVPYRLHLLFGQPQDSATSIDMGRMRDDAEGRIAAL